MCQQTHKQDSGLHVAGNSSAGPNELQHGRVYWNNVAALFFFFKTLSTPGFLLKCRCPHSKELSGLDAHSL